jgi:hypothetical protein
MQFDLVPHPATPPSGPVKIWASVEHASALGAGASTNIWFGIGAPADRFVIPETDEATRTDELWKTTCFEAFLRVEGSDAYREWNFAPSGDWAAYDFTSYREKTADPEISAPYIRMEDNLTWWGLGATIPIVTGHTWQMGVSAILEEKDGTKSYWALAHPDGGKPDFHAPDCFVARLA